MMCKYNIIYQVIIVVMKKTKLDIKGCSRRYFHVLSVQVRLETKVINKGKEGYRMILREICAWRGNGHYKGPKENACSLYFMN